MSQYRITPQNPVRNLSRLDYKRCAVLHNTIVIRGWQDSGRDLNDLDRSSWWQLYAVQTDDIVSRLSPDLISFLRLAQQGHTFASPYHHFHRYLGCLAVPELLIMQNAMYGPDEGDSNKRRFVTLYMANSELLGSHPLGVVYDQEESKALMHMSTGDGNVSTNGRQEWVRLEEILEALLQMMDEGKVRAVGGEYEEEGDGRQERIEPWIMPSFTDRDLQDSINAWTDLLDQIEAKIGLPPCGQDLNGTTVFEEVIPDGAMLPQEGFAWQFLSLARRPRFTFVAPGLRLAQMQPFANVLLDDDVDNQLRPVLLFENEEPAHQDSDTAPWGQVMPRPNFRQHFQEAVAQVPAGLYLTETEPTGSQPFEDGVKLLLPYTIGSAGYARTSDNALIDEHKTEKGAVPRLNTPRSSELRYGGRCRVECGYAHLESARVSELEAEAS